MSLIPQHIIDQVFSETNIVDIIGEYTSLKKAGANYKACCPFHHEKTASFMVSPEKQIFHCFGCGEGGNVASFLMKYEQIDFRAAIEKLADRLNIKIETGPTPAFHNNRDSFFKINAYAKWFFNTCFQESDKAKEYTKARLLKDDTIAMYELGYAPEGFENLVPFLTEKKAPLDLVQKLGLIKKRERSGFYDFFRDRLIFPIHNVAGKIVGFGGRTLNSGEDAKYINSTESPVYNKSHELYGLFQAKKSIVQKKQAIIVEGYLDVLACYQLGIPNVVAPLGTSLTSDQVKNLKKFTSQITLMFDGDSAGITAAKKAIVTCFGLGIHPKLAILPDNKDPGDFLSLNQEDRSLLEQLNHATYAMDWLLAINFKKVTYEAGSRAVIVKELSEWMKRLPNQIESIEYQKKFCQLFDFSPKDLEKIVEITYKSDNVVRPETKEPSLEALLIWLRINDPSQFSGIELESYYKDFSNTKLKQLAEFVEKYSKNHETFDATHAILELPENLSGLLSQIMLLKEWANEYLDPKICLYKFRQLQNKKRLKEITARILEAETNNNTPLKIKLLKEKQTILSQMSQKT